MTILTDDDIADYLTVQVQHLFCASELLIDNSGRRKDLNSILASHLILNEAINELVQLVERLKLDTNVYKTRHDYMRMLRNEKEIAEDEEYYESLSNRKREARESMGSKNTQSSNTVASKG